MLGKRKYRKGKTKNLKLYEGKIPTKKNRGEKQTELNIDDFLTICKDYEYITFKLWWERCNLFELKRKSAERKWDLLKKKMRERGYKFKIKKIGGRNGETKTYIMSYPNDIL